MHKFSMQIHGFIEKRWPLLGLPISRKTFIVWNLDVDTTCRLTQIIH